MSAVAVSLAVALLGVQAPAREPVPAEATAAEAKGEWARAYKLTRPVLDRCERAHGESDRCIDLLVAVSNFARQGAPEGEDLAVIERAVAVTKRVTGDSFDSAAAQNNLGLLLVARNRHAEAFAAMREALRIMRVQGNAEAVSIVAYNLADYLSEAGHYAEAEAPYREALAAEEQVAEASARRMGARLEALAINLMRLSRSDEAETLMRRAIEQSSDGHSAARRTSRLARLVANQGRYDEAISLQQTALAGMVAATGIESAQSNVERNNLAVQLLKRGRLAEAEPLLRQVLAWHERQAKPELFDIAAARANLAELLGLRARPAEAEPLLRAALAGMIAAQGADDEYVGHIHALLGKTLAVLGKDAEAEAELREARRVRAALGIETRTDWIAAQADLAAFLARRGARAAEARGLYLAAERGIRARLAAVRSEQVVLRELATYRGVYAGHVAAAWGASGGSR
jgi:tetratricopeptide (TPR) repeat protein